MIDKIIAILMIVGAFGYLGTAIFLQLRREYSQRR
jgi:hypothetical protein